MRGDRGGCHVLVGEHVAEGLAGGAPPVGGILLSPGRTGRNKGRMRRRRGGDDAAAVVDRDGSRAAGSDVEAEG